MISAAATLLCALRPATAGGRAPKIVSQADHQQYRPNHNGGTAARAARSVGRLRPGRSARRTRCRSHAARRSPPRSPSQRAGQRRRSTSRCRAHGRGRSQRRRPAPWRSATEHAWRMRSRRRARAPTAQSRFRHVGSLTPIMPVTPAAAITAMKVPGTSQSARPPSCAANTPTASMAMRWSSPVNGCAKPWVRSCASPMPGWAATTVGAATRMATSAALQMSDRL